MDAETFLEEFGRMCHSHKSCYSCIMNPDNNSTGETCWVFSKTHPQATISVVEKWSSEHPTKAHLFKTRLQDFLEKYPKAYICPDGYPSVLPIELGYCGERRVCNECECYRHDDRKCWNMFLEE